MIADLDPIKTRIESAKRATRDDIYEALTLIKAAEADRTSEITEMVSGIYSQAQTAKLLSSLDSYAV